MLSNFFQLNRPYTEFETQERLTDFLLNTRDVRDVLYRPSTLEPFPDSVPRLRFKDTRFTNVSFKSTTISRATFRNCEFVDCLFIGTQFIDCEFYQCAFVDCNPHKITFKNTYIDPSVFEGLLDRVKYWNIGIHLFQQLYENSTAMHQPEFANTAEFNRQKWRRYVLDHYYPGLKKINPKCIREWLPNLLYYIFAGYGIRFRFLAAWAVLFGGGSLCLNFTLWDSLHVAGRNGFVEERGLVEVIYYTATMPGGVGDFTPSSDLGRLIFVGESLLGLLIVSLFVTWLVKRALR